MVSFSLLKSPHGRHSPLGLGTTCNGDEYWLFDRRAIPSLTSTSNSSFDTLNFSGERRLACECTGKPVVGIRCWTPCLGTAHENVGVVKAGRLRRSDENLSDAASETM